MYVFTHVCMHVQFFRPVLVLRLFWPMSMLNMQYSHEDAEDNMLHKDYRSVLRFYQAMLDRLKFRLPFCWVRRSGMQLKSINYIYISN